MPLALQSCDKADNSKQQANKDLHDKKASETQKRGDKRQSAKRRNASCQFHANRAISRACSMSSGEMSKCVTARRRSAEPEKRTPCASIF